MQPFRYYLETNWISLFDWRKKRREKAWKSIESKLFFASIFVSTLFDLILKSIRFLRRRHNEHILLVSFFFIFYQNKYQIGFILSIFDRFKWI